MLVETPVEDIRRLVLPHPGYLPSVNAYLVQDSDGYTLIDCGMNTPESEAALREAFATEGIPLNAIVRVLVTHAHHDHMGLAGLLARETGCSVLMHPGDMQLLRDRYVLPQESRARTSNWLLRQGAEPDELPQYLNTSSEQTQHRLEPLENAEPLHDGETWRVGRLNFDLVWTPGHTPGHMCLVERDRRAVICGDHLLERIATHVGILPEAPENPFPRYLESLEFLADETVALEWALPGHGDPFGPAWQRAAALLEHQHARRCAIAELIEEEPRTPVEIARRLWANTTPSNWSQFEQHMRRNGVGQVLAHLEALCAEGRARHVSDAPNRYVRA